MDCWSVLGIAPGSDKKTIKIAYAKLLKIHRPEEDPQGFQTLHTAYKNALKWVPAKVYDDDIPWMQEDGRPVYFEQERLNDIDPTTKDEITLPQRLESDEATIAEVQHSKADMTSVEITLQAPTETLEPWADNEPEISPEDQRLLDEINQQDDRLSRDWETLYQAVNTLMQSKKTANNLQSWAFLERLPAMRDIEFRKAAADKVFEVVAEANELSLAKKDLFIQRPVLNYLNERFSWDKKWQHYQYEYSHSLLEAVFPYLSESEKLVKGVSRHKELYYYRRGVAFAIDMAILLVGALLIETVLEYWGNDKMSVKVIGWWAIIYTLVLVPIQESSRYQGTVGKRIMGLQVMTASGRQLNILHAFWRSIVTIACCLGFKVVIFINILLSWTRSEILQDTLSRSYVLLKSKP